MSLNTFAAPLQTSAISFSIETTDRSGLKAILFGILIPFKASVKEGPE